MEPSTNLFIILVLLTYTNIERTLSFNIEERNPFVKRGEDSGSYFGFSVALHSTKSQGASIGDNWILVGAPLAQNLQPNTNKSGALFKCPIGPLSDDCIQVQTDGKGYGDRDKSISNDYGEDIQSELLPPRPNEIKDNQWLGVSVRSQQPGGKAMVCAHRYITSNNLAYHHYGQGLCYRLDHTLEVEETPLQPCLGLPKDKLHQQYGFCQVGTSLAILSDGYALMGAPGPFTWRGTIFVHNVVDPFLHKDRNTYRMPLSESPYPVDKYSYVGMSSAGGRFFSQTKSLSYASGAPRSHLTGQVFFMERGHATELNVSLILNGVQFGSSFGYEILSLDVDEDGFDDLLVGAPFYYENNHGGAVYVYTNLAKCKETNDCEYSAVLKGKEESRFGFSMASLGDINKDGHPDVAIGAPYEIDHLGGGAVYIYLGNGKGLNPKPSQVIRAKRLATLGYSLSGGLDMDNNGYPDLLVGAYESDMAILYKTRPIIDITINIQSEELTNINVTKKGCPRFASSQNTCFSFKSCFTLGKFTPTKSFQVNYEVRELPRSISRIWFHSEDHENKREAGVKRVLTVNDVTREYCESETVFIKDGISDILSPIKFNVTYTLNNDIVDSPILNRTSVKNFEATFQKNCGDDDVCNSKMILVAAPLLNETTDGYTMDLAKKEEFLLDANVTNEGEAAYEAKLFVKHPEALSYIALQNDKTRTHNVICSVHNSSMVVCNIGNPFPEYKSLNLRLRFEVTDTKAQKLDITVFVNSTSNELSTQTSRSFVTVLQKIAQFTLKGTTIHQNFIFSGDVKGASAMRNLEDIGPTVYHKYQIVNHGQWYMQDIDVVILWPYQVYTTREEGGKWLLYLEGEPKIDNEPINRCTVQPIEAINPLKLAGNPGNSSRVLTFTEEPHKMNRRKRDVDAVAAAQTRIGEDGRQRTVVHMTCQGNATARCAQITCRIKQLKTQEDVSIHIYSRAWNSTLMEDYNKVDWVVMESFAVVRIEDQTITSTQDSIDKAKIETVAYPSTVNADTNVNIWIIVGSVIIGILVLIILVVILYKVGFFKRNRVQDRTLSGNLKKQSESESLLKVNEGKN